MLPIALATELPWWATVLFLLSTVAGAWFLRGRDREDIRRLLEVDRTAQAIGLAFAAWSLGAACVLVYRPVAEAIMGHRMITVPYGVVGFMMMGVYLGLVLLAAGGRSRRLLHEQPGGRYTAAQVALIVAGIALVLGAELGFAMFFRMRGFAPHH
jgi:hypothetical protein